MSKADKDNLYSSVHESIEDFTFDQSVVDVFPDMIKRSVPGYPIIIDAIGQLAAKFAQPNSVIFDLGCSLGAASLSMSRTIDTPTITIKAIDNSPDMVTRCRQNLAAYKTRIPITVCCEDITDVTIENASVVVLNFTLQFIDNGLRDTLIDKIYRGLRPGGILIISEKIRHTNEAGNALLVDLHHEFKRQNGYSELEISQKRSALENVMKTDSYTTHKDRLYNAGFKDVLMWFRWFNFCSIVATKE